MQSNCQQFAGCIASQLMRDISYPVYRLLRTDKPTVRSRSPSTSSVFMRDRHSELYPCGFFVHFDEHAFLYHDRRFT
jgi:hypothetical protein